MSRPRALIISTYQTPCGIAQLTEALEANIKHSVDIEIGRLDQYTLKGQGRRLVEAGDKLIKSICERAYQFDVVNLQWEMGLLGGNHDDIIRRLKMIAAIKKPLVVTVHTVLNPKDRIGTRQAISLLRQRRFSDFRNQVAGWGNRNYAPLLKRQQQGLSTHIITHTKRDERFFREALGFKEVASHPLSYLHPGWLERIEVDAQTLRQSWDEAYGVGGTYIGLYGFFGRYKGFETAIRALRYLPENYKVLLFGTVHPSSIAAEIDINDTTNSLLNAVRPDLNLAQTYLSSLKMVSGAGRQINSTAVETMNTIFGSMGRDLKDLSHRVLFMGSPDDYEFITSMKATDVNVFPYLEIGQSASGPATTSVELGAKTICSRTKTFSELARFYPGKIDFFEVGNVLGLAQKIESSTMREPKSTSAPFDRQTQAAFYEEIFSGTSRKGLITQ